MAQGHSVDEYLETIYFLAFPIGEYTPRGAGTPPLASRVAEMLHVSRASAGEMLKRLEADGLIERGVAQGGAAHEDRPRARRARRPQAPADRAAAHRLHGLHGRRGARARRPARRHVHDEMIERIDEKLGHPDRCPHGWPVDPTSSSGRTSSSRAARRADARHACDDRPARRARRRAPALVLRPGARSRAADRDATAPSRRPTVRRPADRRLRTASARSPRRPPPASSSAPRRRRASSSTGPVKRASERATEPRRGRRRSVVGDAPSSHAASSAIPSSSVTCGS